MKTEYVASFALVRPLFHATVPLYASARGRIGTDKGDPLNYLECGARLQTPIRSIANGWFSVRATGEAQYSGTQTFDRSSWGFLAGLEGLIPNLIDLTGGANRLRLKPVLHFGGGYSIRPQEQPQFPGTDSSWELFTNFDYYIPVASKYALTYAAQVRYFDNALPDEKLHFWNSLALSYDLPLKDLKAMVRWESGRNPYVSDESKRLLVGALMDYLPF